MKYEELFYHIILKGKKDNTYKFALAKFLLDYSKNTKETGDIIIKFKTIAESFLKYYWHQDVKYKFKHNFQKEKIPVIISLIRKYCGNDYIPDDFDKYFEKNHEIKNILLNEIENKVFNDVIPRFQPYDLDSKYYFYEHNYEKSNKKFQLKGQKEILLKESAKLFFQENYLLLHKFTILEWAKFLEKVNFTPKLISKIENLENPKRNSLNKFKKILEQIDQNYCFYCGKKLNKNKIHIDHFIPWSYVYEDNPWNLVLSCSDCNLTKKDFLPPKKCLIKLKSRNEKKKEFKIYNELIEELYENAKNYGFLVIDNSLKCLS